MLVEFTGGSLDKQEQRIERFFEYINNNGEIYYAKAARYDALRWVYVWYEFAGQYQNEMV